jgi:SAM-dependent methyltransferase
VWDPYLHALGNALHEVRRVEPSFDDGFVEVDGRALAREAAGRVARTWLRRAYATAARLKPRRRADHSQSWKREDVALQMRALARHQLEDPPSVPPYRAFLEAVDYALAELPLPEPARFLDFGCGVGHYSELLERRYPGRFDYTGCDYSPAMVEAARAEWPGRTFVVNDLFANTLDLASFDLVVASALVDIAEDYERALDALLGSPARFVLLHRQQLTDGPSRAEVVPGYSGQTTYRSYLNRADLERIASRHGRVILNEFQVDGDIHSFMFGEAA